jgi:hypothetical protein
MFVRMFAFTLEGDSHIIVVVEGGSSGEDDTIEQSFVEVVVVQALQHYDETNRLSFDAIPFVCDEIFRLGVELATNSE